MAIKAKQTHMTTVAPCDSASYSNML